MMDKRRILLLLALAAIPAPAGLAAQAVPAITPDVVYGHKDGMALTFDVFRPAAPNGAGVLYIVSGGWVSRWIPPERAASAFAGLLEKGFTVFAVRHGSSPRYKVPEAAGDVERAVRFIRLRAADFGVDAHRLGVYGGSAGGHLSLMLGLDPDPGTPDADDEVLRTPSGLAAVVAYFPPVDLRPITGPSERFPALDFPTEQAASVSPILFASADDPPTLLIHGDADRLVPIRNSQAMYDALRAAGATTEFITIPGGDHGWSDADHRQQASAAMVAWFERFLLR